MASAEAEDLCCFFDEEIRVIIKFLWAQRKSQKEILDEINRTCGGNRVSKDTVYRWMKRFDEGNFD